MMNGIRNGPLGKFFASDKMISGEYGCGSNWGHGYCDQGNELIDDVVNIIRREVEFCDNLQGFQISHSIIGGTGSGFGSLLMNKLREDYPDRLIMTFSCFTSSEIDECVIEPYNIVLGLHHLIENVDMTCCFHNELLYKICSQTQSSPTFNHLNNSISKVMSGLTTCFRFSDQINNDMRKFTINMIPFPCLHFLCPSFAPFYSSNNLLTVHELTKQIFDERNLIFPCNIQQGQSFGMTTIFRGEISMKELDYLSSETMKISLSTIPLKEFQLSSTLIRNHTGIQDIFKSFLQKFSTMFRRKLYIFGLTRSGLDEMEFTEAENNLQELINEYENIIST
ncbi:hypothetical protein I4U23_005892 [Adineta vaga]|nr:hypothetical protein I4U23_005892 [Adineta vaga]